MFRPSMRQTLLMVLCVLLAPASARAESSVYQRTAEELSQAMVLSRKLGGQRVPYDVVFRRDPMRACIDAEGHLVSVGSLHGGLSVQGILWSEAHPFVVVDDELFSEGDAIGPFTLLEIRSDGVVAQRDGQTLFIPLDRGIETPAVIQL